jgi:hypothetical protein
MTMLSSLFRSSTRSSVRAMLAATVAVGALTACGDDNAIGPDAIVGVFSATTFRVTPAGAAEIDVLQEGGDLVITIAGGNTTTGTLTLPAAVTGAAASESSMAGTAIRNGSGVTFEQSADTFVRDLNWTYSNNAISVTNQSVGGATYTIVLTR